MTFLDHLKQRSKRSGRAPTAGAQDGLLAADPVKARADGAARDVLTVTQAGDLIRSLFDAHAPRPLRVVGEISNLSDRRHLYFSLKDDESVLRCVAWESQARKFGFMPQDGMEVVATGHLQFYQPQGSCQLYVSQLDPVGAGALELRLRALIDELRNLGYFDPARKKPFPTLPRRIAIITSANGAAVADVLDTMRRRCPAVDALVVDVHVQGPRAAPEIVHAIDWLGARGRQLGVDAIILTRGGGSIEDLWAFNERAVADALLRCPLPVAAAIGHEVDTTVAELVADVRCATPTQAAMFVVPDRVELLAHIRSESGRLVTALERRVRDAERSVDKARSDLGEPENIIRTAADCIALRAASIDRVIAHRFRDAERCIAQRRIDLERLRPEAVLARQRERRKQALARLQHALRTRLRTEHQALDRTQETLERALPRSVGRWEERLSHLHAQLRSLSPRTVLTRGYSITRVAEGPVVRDSAEVAPGQTLETILAVGSIRSRVVLEAAAGEPANLDADGGGRVHRDTDVAGGAERSPTGRASRSPSPRHPGGPAGRTTRRQGGLPPSGTNQLDLFIDHLEDRTPVDRQQQPQPKSPSPRHGGA